MYAWQKSILNPTKGKNISHIQRKTHQNKNWLLNENLKFRRVRSKVFQVLKDHDGLPRLTHTGKLFTIVEGEKKISPWLKIYIKQVKP